MRGQVCTVSGFSLSIVYLLRKLKVKCSSFHKNYEQLLKMFKLGEAKERYEVRRMLDLTNIAWLLLIIGGLAAIGLKLRSEIKQGV